MAIGQVGGWQEESFAGRISVNERGFIDTDPDQRTALARVYAAGDTVSGPSSVVRAMAAGRRAAATMPAIFPASR